MMWIKKKIWNKSQKSFGQISLVHPNSGSWNKKSLDLCDQSYVQRPGGDVIGLMYKDQEAAGLVLVQRPGGVGISPCKG